MATHKSTHMSTNVGTALPLTLSEADLSSIVGMAWQDDTPFEAINLQFGLTEPQVIALMRTSLKARSFRLWRMRVRGRSAKHLALQQARHRPDHSPYRTHSPRALAAEPEDFPLPPSPITRQSLR